MRLLTEDSCPICNGKGEVLSEKARVIGYTLADRETIDEEFVPCPLCQRVEAERKETLKAVGEWLDKCWLPKYYSSYTLQQGIQAFKRGEMPEEVNE